MLARSVHLTNVRRLLLEFAVVAIVGARQTGKTTLAADVARGFGGPTHHFDLEDPRDEARLAAPMLALEPLSGLVIIDEIQRRPDLFPVLRVLADKAGARVRYLILGSAAPELIRGSGESLAGRVAHHELPGLDLSEVGTSQVDVLWRRGGLPRSMLAASDAASLRWRREYIRAYLERDIPTLGLRLAPATLRRFWSMLAHYSGQLWSGAEMARAFGVSEPTVRHYLDILVGTCMVRLLPPWFENVSKRQVRAPKIYLADSGLLHALLDLPAHEQALLGHPRVGASWEGFALQQVVQALGVDWRDCHHWRAHTGAELDLLVFKDGRRIGFEIKRTDSPRVTASMRSARDVLRLEALYVIHAGQEAWPLEERVFALPLGSVFERFSASQRSG